MTEATEEEAVYRSFGRRNARSFVSDVWEDCKEGDLAGGAESVASAYMLVYIRCSDVAEVMRCVTPDEVPIALASAVETQIRMRDIETRIAEQDKEFQSLTVYSEDAVRRWSRVREDQDLIEEGEGQETRLRKQDFSLLGLVYTAAELISIPPFRLRLYCFESRLASSVGSEGGDSDDEGTQRLSPLSLEFDDKDAWALDRIYAHALPMVEDSEMANQHEYKLLLDECAKILDEARATLPDSADFDWLRGCGLGFGVDHFRSKVEDRGILAAFDRLQERALDLARQAATPRRTEALLFYRVFDLFGELSCPSDSADPHFPYRFIKSEALDVACIDDIVSTCDEIIEAFMEGVSDDVKERWASPTVLLGKSALDIVILGEPDMRSARPRDGDVVYITRLEESDDDDMLSWNNFQLNKRCYSLRPEGALAMKLFNVTTIDLIPSWDQRKRTLAIARALGAQELVGNMVVLNTVPTIGPGKRNGKHRRSHGLLAGALSADLESIRFIVCPFRDRRFVDRIYVDMLVTPPPSNYNAP